MARRGKTSRVREREGNIGKREKEGVEESATSGGDLGLAETRVGRLRSVRGGFFDPWLSPAAAVPATATALLLGYTKNGSLNTESNPMHWPMAGLQSPLPSIADQPLDWCKFSQGILYPTGRDGQLSLSLSPSFSLERVVSTHLHPPSIPFVLSTTRYRPGDHRIPLTNQRPRTIQRVCQIIFLHFSIQKSKRSLLNFYNFFSNHWIIFKV